MAISGASSNSIQAIPGLTNAQLISKYGSVEAAIKYLSHANLIKIFGSLPAALEYYAWQGEIEKVKYIVAQDAFQLSDMDIVSFNNDLCYHTSSFNSERVVNLQKIEAILAIPGVNVNARNANRKTSLLMACASLDMPLVTLLLKNGANTNCAIENPSGRVETPLSATLLAIAETYYLNWTGFNQNTLMIIDILIEHAADINGVGGIKTPLDLAHEIDFQKPGLHLAERLRNKYMEYCCKNQLQLLMRYGILKRIGPNGPFRNASGIGEILDTELPGLNIAKQISNHNSAFFDRNKAWEAMREPNTYIPSQSIPLNVESSVDHEATNDIIGDNLSTSLSRISFD